MAEGPQRLIQSPLPMWSHPWHSDSSLCSWFPSSPLPSRPRCCLCGELFLFFFLFTPSIPHPRQPLRPHLPQPRKKLIRLLNVLRNLRFQLFWPPKLLLLPQFLPEPYLNPLRRKIPRIIQQVRLHR